MKKILCAVVFFAGFLLAEILVPVGATMEATVKTSVPVSEIKITRLVCELSNSVPSYAVTFCLIGTDGGRVAKTIRVNNEQAAAMMYSAGYSLTNVISAAMSAVQCAVNSQFVGQ